MDLGESVKVSGAYSDPEVVSLIIGLKNRKWSSEKDTKGHELQSAYDEILTLVRQKHSKSKPQAKLGRLFAALLPEDMWIAFSWKSQINEQERSVVIQNSGCSSC